MRHSWRLLLLQSRNLRSSTLTHSRYIVSVESVPSFSSVRQVGSFFVDSKLTSFASSSMLRSFTSEAAVELKDSDKAALLGDIFSKHEDSSDIRREIELHNIAITDWLILKVLKGLDASPDVAWKFFGWVSESNGEQLKTNSYNCMLRILGLNGSYKEFWDLVDIMRGKGYVIFGFVRNKMLKKFKKERRNSDIEKLRDISQSIDESVKKSCTQICGIVMNEDWNEEVERELRGLDFELTSDFVGMILRSLASEPSKALIFFRWVEESGYFKHDTGTYNAMARVLRRNDSIDSFWKFLDEMRTAGHSLERKTCAIVLRSLLARNMIEESVNFYEFATAGSDKPAVRDCNFLLKKIAGSKPFDRALFPKVVNIFCGDGNVPTYPMLREVACSLIKSCSGMETYMIFKMMKEASYSDNPDDQRQGSFVCDIIEWLVSILCDGNRAVNACKLTHECVSKDQIKPHHSTYKLLISELLVKGEFKHALGLLDLMKRHDFPPFLDPFIEYIPKRGSGEDAVAFARELTSKSISVYIRMFKGFFKAGRREEAQDFLAASPKYIREHADVLSLFCPKPKPAVSAMAS